MAWSCKDFLKKVKGCVVGQITNEQHVLVRKKLSIFTSEVSLIDKRNSFTVMRLCIRLQKLSVRTTGHNDLSPILFLHVFWGVFFYENMDTITAPHPVSPEGVGLFS